MSKQLILLSGLPRSGSTLLANLLAQNPQVHSTATSGLHEIMYISKAFFKTEEFRSIPNPKEGEQLFLDYHRAGLTHAFDNLTDRPVVADKCRSWIGSIGLALQMFPEAKILIPVRDIRGVLSSMEKKFQQHPAFQMEMSQQDTQMIQTVEGRVNFWLSRPPIGIAIERIHEIARLHKDKVHFVHFEKLSQSPNTTMQDVWRYLGMAQHEHDFENVEQYTHEHELGWPYGEHEIRNEVRPVKADWNEVLGSQLSEQINQKFAWINTL